MESQTKRPALVWVIALFYGLSCLAGLRSSWLVFTKRIPLTSAQEAYFSALGTMDWVTSVAIAGVGIAGVIALFMLRRVAVALLAAAFAAGILQTFIQALTTSWAEAIGTVGVIGALIGWCIPIIILIYTWRLAQNGVLK